MYRSGSRPLCDRPVEMWERRNVAVLSSRTRLPLGCCFVLLIVLTVLSFASDLSELMTRHIHNASTLRVPYYSSSDATPLGWVTHHSLHTALRLTELKAEGAKGRQRGGSGAERQSKLTNTGRRGGPQAKDCLDRLSKCADLREHCGDGWVRHNCRGTCTCGDRRTAARDESTEPPPRRVRLRDGRQRRDGDLAYIVAPMRSTDDAVVKESPKGPLLDQKGLASVVTPMRSTDDAALKKLLKGLLKELIEDLPKDALHDLLSPTPTVGPSRADASCVDDDAALPEFSLRHWNVRTCAAAARLCQHRRFGNSVRQTCRKTCGSCTVIQSSRCARWQAGGHAHTIVTDERTDERTNGRTNE